MKRSEFVALVNEVMEEERTAALERLDQLKSTSEHSQEFLSKLIAESYIQSVEVAAITAGKIIEKAGLILFDPETPD